MFYNWYSVYNAYHMTITFALYILHILYIIFAPDFLKNALITILMTAVILLAMRLVNDVMDMIIHKLDKPKIRNVVTSAALGIILVLGFAPRVLVYFIGWNYSELACIFLVTASISCTIFAIVFWERIPYRNHYAKWGKAICALSIIHVVLLVASIRLAVTYDNIWDTVAIILFQVLFLPTCLVSNIDLVLVLITWKRGNQKQVASADLEAAPEGGPCHECDICLLPYSTQNIPRLLKECGHTICTDCATKLLAVHKNVYLLCPNCRMATVVRGPATRIPRNHALMGLIEEMKRKKK